MAPSAPRKRKPDHTSRPIALHKGEGAYDRTIFPLQPPSCIAQQSNRRIASVVASLVRMFRNTGSHFYLAIAPPVSHQVNDDVGKSLFVASMGDPVDLLNASVFAMGNQYVSLYREDLDPSFRDNHTLYGHQDQRIPAFANLPDSSPFIGQLRADRKSVMKSPQAVPGQMVSQYRIEYPCAVARGSVPWSPPVVGPVKLSDRVITKPRRKQRNGIVRKLPCMNGAGVRVRMESKQEMEEEESDSELSDSEPSDDSDDMSDSGDDYPVKRDGSIEASCAHVRVHLVSHDARFLNTYDMLERAHEKNKILPRGSLFSTRAIFV